MEPGLTLLFAFCLFCSFGCDHRAPNASENASLQKSEEGLRGVGRELTTTLDVSLDRTVMPEPVNPFLMGSTAVLAVLAGIAVVARIPRALGALG